MIDVIAISREKASEFVTDRPFLFISIRDPRLYPVVIPDNPHQVARIDLAFNDINELPEDVKNKHPEIKSFSIDDAKAVLEVFRLTKNYINLIVINCEAGVSRSAGMAAAFRRILLQSDEEFFKKCGDYCPNTWVYKTTLNTAIEMRIHGNT